MSLGVLHASVEIAERVVSGSGEEAREGQRGVVAGIGHLFVAANALLRHQIGVGAAPSRRSVFVVNVHHQLVLGTFLHGIVQPGGPHLIAYLHEAELDTFHTHLLIERQDAVELVVECALIDIEPDAHALAAGVVTNLAEREVALWGDAERTRRDLHLRTVPSGVELHIFYSEVVGKVDALLDPFFIQLTAAEGATGADVVVELTAVALVAARSVEREQQLLVVDELHGAFCCHDEAPWGRVGRDDVGVVVHGHP